MIRLSIKHKLFFSILCLLMLGLLASTAVAYFQVRSSLLKAAYDEQLIKSHAASAELTQWLKHNLSVVGAFAHRLAASENELRHNPNFQFYLEQTTQSRRFEYLAYALEGDGYYAINDWSVPEAYDPRKRPWYQASKQAMKPLITPSYQGYKDQIMYVAVTAPILRDGRFIGVVSGDVTLDIIKNAVLDIELDAGGFAFLTNRNGRILIHPDSQLQGINLTELDQVESGLLGHPLFEQDQRKLIESQIVEGQNYLYSTIAIPQSDWILVLAADKGKIYAQLYRETASLLGYFLAIFVLVMMVFYTSNRHIFAPLIDLLELDANTRLPNKRYFKQQVSAKLLSSSSNGMLVIVSLDQFNRLTAAYSPDVILALLNQVKDRIQSHLSQGALLGLFSESRFIAYADNPDQMSDLDRLLWLQAKTNELSCPYMIDGKELNCSFSLGVSYFPDHGCDVEELIDNVFSVMAKDKQLGVSSYGVFTPGINQQISDELLIASAMQNALRDGEFHMVYQPQVDSDATRMVAMEALIRWDSSELARMVSPAEFIPIAEASDLIVLLGDYVINTVAGQIRVWDENGFEFSKVSINISPKQLLKGDFLDKLLCTLSRHGVAPHRLELEITETSVLENPEEGIAILNRLKSAGFCIAIDDFGTGYSSLEYLKMMPVDKLKIDRTFVRDLPHSEKDAIIVEMIVAMAKALNYQVLAEGVERVEQLEFLSASGCSLIQGYYFAKPMKASAIETFADKKVVNELPA